MKNIKTVKIICLVFIFSLSVSTLFGVNDSDRSKAESIRYKCKEYSKSQQYDKAIKCFNKALGINPHSYGIYDDLGVTYGLKGELEKAITMFEKSAKMVAYLDPGPLRNLGYAYAAKGDFNKAINTFKKALTLSWGNLEIIDQLARMYANLNNYKMAVHYWKEFIKLSNNSVIHMNIANSYMQLKDTKKAHIYYRKSCNLGFEMACKKLKK